MKQVWKYTLALDDYQDIDMQIGAEVLSLDVQHNTICIWALVDPEKGTEKRRFRIAGTGHPITDQRQLLNFIGTVMTADCALVFHIFELLSE